MSSTSSFQSWRSFGSLACSIFILVEAFRDEVWKGVVSLLCGLYFFYWALFEFDHENKWLLVLGAFGGGSIAAGLLRLSMGLGV